MARFDAHDWWERILPKAAKKLEALGFKAHIEKGWMERWGRTPRWIGAQHKRDVDGENYEFLVAYSFEVNKIEVYHEIMSGRFLKAEYHDDSSEAALADLKYRIPLEDFYKDISNLPRKIDNDIKLFRGYLQKIREWKPEDEPDEGIHSWFRELQSKYVPELKAEKEREEAERRKEWERARELERQKEQEREDRLRAMLRDESLTFAGMVEKKLRGR